jgi:hypothetical protein
MAIPAGLAKYIASRKSGKTSAPSSSSKGAPGKGMQANPHKATGKAHLAPTAAKGSNPVNMPKC